MIEDTVHDLINLIGVGLSPAEAVDYWAVEINDVSVSDWAEVRGVSRQAINKNKVAAKRALAE